MEFISQESQGRRFIEGIAGKQLIPSIDDVSGVLEACFNHAADGLLLYSENLTSRFFDLKSGEAGAILQKLRMYHIRLAVVRSPTVQLSKRFSELMVEEQRSSYFRLFGDRESAQEWLCGT